MLLFVTLPVYAADQVTDLQNRIDDTTAQIKRLDTEIKAAGSLAASAG